MPPNRKLDLAYRKSRGERIRADWMRKLEAASGYAVAVDSFLPLEQTEALKRSFFEKIKMGTDIHRYYAPIGSMAQIAAALLDLSIELRLKPVILFSSEDQHLGAVQLPASIVLSNFRAIWQVTGQDFAITTLDLQSGLCIENACYDEHGQYVKEGLYQIDAWGEFSRLVLKDLKQE